MIMPEISVVIPCYNQGAYVHEAVESVLAQTCQPLEIIIVDDGSTDESTAKALSRYSGSGITILRTENRGPAAARNSGVRASGGRYILTLDADDWFEPTFIERAAAILDTQGGVGVVTCWYRAFGARSDVRRPPGGGVADFLVRNCCPASALFRRQCWIHANGWDESMRSSCEDWEFWISVVRCGWQVHTIPEVLFNYRVHPGTRSGAPGEVHVEGLRRIVEKHKEVFAQHIVAVVCGKEQLWMEKERIIQTILDSPRYRLGSAIFAILRPLKPVASLLGRRNKKKPRCQE